MVKEITLTCGLIAIVHGYILLSAVVYNILEGRHGVMPKHHYSEQYLSRALKSWTPKLTNTQSPEFQQFIANYKDAVKEDDKMENKRAFQSLAKAYMFALTSIATVGNSGMTVTTVGGKSFYLASIITGIVLYFTMLHRISLPLMETMRYAADHICCGTDEYGNTRRNPYPKLTVMIMCNVFVVISILVFAVGGVFSGHSYLYGLFTTYDSVLTVGNEKWLPLIANWSETVFVLSLSLFLLIELSMVYTTIFASLDAATDGECKKLITALWERRSPDGYVALSQGEGAVPYEDYEIIKSTEEGESIFPDIYAVVEEKGNAPVYDKVEEHEPSEYQMPTEMEMETKTETARIQQLPTEGERVYDEVEGGKTVEDDKTAEDRRPDDSQDIQDIHQSADVLPKPPSLIPPIGTTSPDSILPQESPESTPQAEEEGIEAESPIYPEDENVPAPYYESYVPQSDLLEVPSRRSSSEGSEYSNISVTDYETSLIAELERSREYLDSKKE